MKLLLHSNCYLINFGTFKFIKKETYQNDKRRRNAAKNRTFGKAARQKFHYSITSNKHLKKIVILLA